MSFLFFVVFGPKLKINLTIEVTKAKIMPRRSRCLIFVKIRFNYALKNDQNVFRKNPTHDEPNCRRSVCLRSAA